MIQAVCFDLWNTLIVEGRDGLVRPRLELWEQGLRAMGHTVTAEALEAAHAAMFVEFQSAWKTNNQYVSISAAQHVCAALGLDHDSAAVELVADAFDPAGRTAGVEVTPGAAACLGTLREAGLRIAVICDVGLVPSTALRWHLADNGLLPRIDEFVFSDESGVYKPHPLAFELALQRLGGVPPSAAAHVGDRMRTDVLGAVGAGLWAVRYSGVYDDPEAIGAERHDVVTDLMELPALLGL